VLSWVVYITKSTKDQEQSLEEHHKTNMYLKKQIGNGVWGIKWSCDRLRNATLKGQRRDPIRIEPNILKMTEDAIS